MKFKIKIRSPNQGFTRVNRIIRNFGTNFTLGSSSSSSCDDNCCNDFCSCCNCGGIVPTPCCPNTLLPVSVFAILSGTTGNCGCLEGRRYQLDWNGNLLTPVWVSSNAAICNHSLGLNLSCLTGLQWTINSNINNSDSCLGPQTTQQLNCSPLSITFINVSVVICCTGTVNIVITQ